MWWSNLTDYQQVLFIVAVAATAVMVLFIILMLIGFDNSEFDGIDDFDVDADLDIDSINDEPLSSIAGLKVFTIRGILAFLSMGSWITFIFLDIVDVWLATLIGILGGYLSAYLLALALKQAMKLENSGNMDYRKAIGKSATVYIRIPKARASKGKVNLLLEGRYAEVDAITDDQEDLKSGMQVYVNGVFDETILVVSKNKKGD